MRETHRAQRMMQDANTAFDVGDNLSCFTHRDVGRLQIAPILYFDYAAAEDDTTAVNAAPKIRQVNCVKRSARCETEDFELSMIKRLGSNYERQFRLRTLRQAAHLQRKSVRGKKDVRRAHFPFADTQAQTVGEMDLFDRGIFDNHSAEMIC